MFGKRTKRDTIDFPIQNKYKNYGKIILSFYYCNLDSALQIDYIGIGEKKELINYSITLAEPCYNQENVLRLYLELKNNNNKSFSTLEKLVIKHIISF